MWPMRSWRGYPIQRVVGQPQLNGSYALTIIVMLSLYQAANVLISRKQAVHQKSDPVGIAQLSCVYISRLHGLNDRAEPAHKSAFHTIDNHPSSGCKC